MPPRESDPGAGARRPLAVVSGGSRGIGRAIVAQLATDGYDVAFCYRSDDCAADTAAKEVRAAGGRCLGARVDVANADEVRRFAAEVDEEFGPEAVDLVVTSAGITRDRPLAMMSDEDWDQVLRVNLDGTHHVCRAFIRTLTRTRGAVVTLSSVAGVHGSVGQANYAAAKAGIIAFTRTVAREYGRFGVRANVVAPGLIDTEMIEGMGEKGRSGVLARVPLGRIGSAEEVAELVAFLASDRARYVTGQVLGIDGGFTG